MKCPIHKTDLVCLSCIAAKGGRVGGQARTEAKRRSSQRNVEKAIAASLAARKKRAKEKEPPLDRSTIWGMKDCRMYFMKHPGRSARAEDLIAAAPANKRESARRYATQRLHLLAKQGEIEQVERGVYRLPVQ